MPGRGRTSRSEGCLERTDDPVRAGSAGLVSAAGSVARRPDLWPVALRSLRDLARPGWWRHPPFLPLPDRDWLGFRLETAYGGDGTGPMTGDDLVTWLEWRRSWSG